MDKAPRQKQPTQAQQHLQAGLAMAKLMAERATKTRVRIWAYHMKRMLEAKD